MTYQQAITERCTEYARNPMARFIGYNTVYGSRIYSTLNLVPTNQCLETPVAENLMMGLAMGMALEGYRPVVCFERHDFLLLAMDAIINQMDKMPWMSGDQFKFPIIIRAIVGSTTPINPGPMHMQDYTSSLRLALKHTPIHMPRSLIELKRAWGDIHNGAVIIVEHKDDYNRELYGS